MYKKREREYDLVNFVRIYSYTCFNLFCFQDFFLQISYNQVIKSCDTFVSITFANHLVLNKKTYLQKITKQKKRNIF